MPAIPLIVMGATAAAGAYSAHKQSQAASESAGMQKSLLDRQSALSNRMQSLGEGQISSSKPALDAAMKHYLTLAQGGRGEINSLLAPDRAAVNETARGTQRGIEAHMAPGAQRDQAIADISRQRQGQLGLLPIQARTDAMGKLATLGGQGQDRGYNFMTGAAGALGGQTAGINSMFNMQQAGQAGWGQLGSDMFKMYGDYLMNSGKGSQKALKSNPWNSIGTLPMGSSGNGGWGS